ncbi:hypothetical protein [Nannocystis pusilla]|uniref:hypothetical protein n=1 Tax=Nannocystis pusilla TaxID=889268 RepID=UPI003DA63B2C
MLTPIAIVFWAGAAVFLTCSNLFALVWWQQALGFLAFFAVWGGLVERWSRSYFARRRMLLLAGHPAALAAAPAKADASPPSPRVLLDDSPRELVPLQKQQSEPPIVATAEFWDYAFGRLFGRAAPVAHVVFDVACVLALFYPTWTPTLVVVLVAIVISLWFGLWQRRLLLQLKADAQADPALAEPRGRLTASEQGRGERGTTNRLPPCQT